MKKKQESTAIARKPPGPQTAQGKARSRKNSQKHGILALELFLLPGERPADFRLLQEGLREEFDPQGCMQELEVDTLAGLLWRRRRVCYAETAEISRANESNKFDFAQQRAFPARPVVLSSDDGGLLGNISPVALRAALELLADLRDDFQRRGFDQDQDSEILQKIYGDSSLDCGFPGVYISLARFAGNADAWKPSLVDREDARAKTVAAIDKEIERISNLVIEIENVESRSRAYAVRALVVPPPELRELLMRYESHLSREIDRTLVRFERLRKMRGLGDS